MCLSSCCNFCKLFLLKLSFHDCAYSFPSFQYTCDHSSFSFSLKCCRFSLSVTIDLTYSSSPTLPTLTPITFIKSPASPIQQFFFTASHPQAHPLVYYLGDSMDYRSSQAGTPQGLEISYTTGHVTWDISHVMPGDYSVQIVVEDAFTGIRVRERKRKRGGGGEGEI